MSKYKSKKITVDGIAFDSKIEAKYYDKLKMDKALSLIVNFELQPKFTLQAKFSKYGKNFRAIGLKADFTVYELDGSTTIIDIKGYPTPEAKLKRKMYDFLYEAPLLWIVWDGGEWRSYDIVEKGRAERRKLKK